METDFFLKESEYRNLLWTYPSMVTPNVISTRLDIHKVSKIYVYIYWLVR